MDEEFQKWWDSQFKGFINKIREQANLRQGHYEWAKAGWDAALALSNKHPYAGDDMGEGSAAKPLTPAHPTQPTDKCPFGFHRSSCKCSVKGDVSSGSTQNREEK